MFTKKIEPLFPYASEVLRMFKKLFPSEEIGSLPAYDAMKVIEEKTGVFVDWNSPVDFRPWHAALSGMLEAAE